jgi:hypothetical protein
MLKPCLRHLRAAAAAAALSLAAVAPSYAVCMLCTSAVRLDRSLALCFQQRIDIELRRLESEGRGIVIVDLSDCQADDGRTGLPTDPKQQATLDRSFVADGDSLRCLGEAIASYNGSLDPSVLFDLTKICT